MRTSAPPFYLRGREGRAVAAVEVNGTEPLVILRAGSDGAEREAVALASLALLWEPGAAGQSD